MIRKTVTSRKLHWISFDTTHTSADFQELFYNLLGKSLTEQRHSDMSLRPCSILLSDDV